MGVQQPGIPSRIHPVRNAILSVKRALWSKEKKAPIYFMMSSISVTLAQMVAGIVVVWSMAPQDLGIWHSVNLALTYSVFLLAGVGNGLSRELPYYLGAGEVQEANRLAGTTLTYNNAICLVALVGGAGTTAFLLAKHHHPKYVLAVGAVTLLILFNFYQNYLLITFRSKSSFADLADVQMKQTFLIIATIPLLYFLGYEGLVLRFVLVGGVGLYLMHRVRPLKIDPVWNVDALKVLLKTGIPIFALDYFRTVAATSDRLALLHSGGVKQVGFYALALSVYSGFATIPLSINQYIYPRMSFQYGRDKNPRALWSLAWKVTAVSIAIMLPLAFVGWFLLPSVVKALFPNYVEGTHAAQLMLLAAVCGGAVTGVNALWSLKAWKPMVLYQVIFSTLLATGPFVGVSVFSSPLTGVAYGTLAARFISAIVAVVLTYFATHRMIPEKGLRGQF